MQKLPPRTQTSCRVYSACPLPSTSLATPYCDRVTALQRKEKQGISKTAASLVLLLDITKDKLCATDARLQASNQG